MISEIRVHIKGKAIYIDAITLPYFLMFKWHIIKDGHVYYVCAGLPRFLMGGKRRIYLHHLVMYWVGGYYRQYKKEIDHIDGNGLNNTFSNLRIVSSSKNKTNRHYKHKNATSKYIGVSRHSKNNMFEARIRKNNKQHYIGSYKTESAAHRAYKNASR